MHQPAPFRGEANTSLAHILAHAIESSDKPKHQIAREVGIHRETLRAAIGRSALMKPRAFSMSAAPFPAPA